MLQFVTSQILAGCQSIRKMISLVPWALIQYKLRIRHFIIKATCLVVDTTQPKFAKNLEGCCQLIPHIIICSYLRIRALYTGCGMSTLFVFLKQKKVPAQSIIQSSPQSGPQSMVQLLHYPLTHYLGQLDNPQISFNIKQKQPKTLDEALS